MLCLKQTSESEMNVFHYWIVTSVISSVFRIQMKISDISEIISDKFGMFTNDGNK